MPLVVKVYLIFFVAMLVTTVAIWGLDIWAAYVGQHQADYHLYEIFADGSKVVLGAVIGVLSQWASQEFGKQSG